MHQPGTPEPGRKHPRCISADQSASGVGADTDTCASTAPVWAELLETGFSVTRCVLKEAATCWLSVVCVYLDDYASERFCPKGKARGL